MIFLADGVVNSSKSTRANPMPFEIIILNCLSYFMPRYIINRCTQRDYMLRAMKHVEKFSDVPREFTLDEFFCTSVILLSLKISSMLVII